MHVDVKDPDDKTVLSRVSVTFCVTNCSSNLVSTESAAERQSVRYSRSNVMLGKS